MNTPTASDGAVHEEMAALYREYRDGGNHELDAVTAVVDAMLVAYPPIDRAKLLALADRVDCLFVMGDGIGDRRAITAELRALLGGEP